MAKPSVSNYLTEQQRKSSGELAQEWTTLEELYNKKLWHQLTLKLLVFVKHASFSQGDGLIKLYHNFISDFEHRINPLSFMEIIIIIIKQIKDANESLEFLDKIKEKVKLSTEATILLGTAKGNLRLAQKEMPLAKELIQEAQEELEKLDGVTSVHGRFYELSSNYHKLIGNHAEYYREALHYLGCIDIADIPAPDQKDRAFNLGLAAILGKGVYNFGELLAHPILEALKTTDKQWLVDLLYAFNSGDLGRFDELKVKWGQQPDLASQEIAMRRKITLLCLMEMTFKRPANNRQLSFTEISKEARVEADEVELLVMKALSLGLVKGSIDQVDQKVHMTWVQPRVLDRQQIGTMQKKLETWCKDVLNMETMVESKAHDILT